MGHMQAWTKSTQQMVLLSGPEVLLRSMKKKKMSWHPSKEEIQDWIEVKEDKFSLRETQGLRVNTKEWKGIYLYSDMHELFFMLNFLVCCMNG
jgi:hypothetical protein